MEASPNILIWHTYKPIKWSEISFYPEFLEVFYD